MIFAKTADFWKGLSEKTIIPDLKFNLFLFTETMNAWVDMFYDVKK